MSTNSNLMKDDGLFWLILIIFMMDTCSTGNTVDENNELLKEIQHDYRIDLSRDSCSHVIYITDKNGHMNIIHPDSLEEFIKEDEL